MPLANDRQSMRRRYVSRSTSPKSRVPEPSTTGISAIVSSSSVSAAIIWVRMSPPPKTWTS